MSNPKIDRRLLLGGMALAAGAAAATTASQAQPAAFAPAPQALPFDPKGVAGLSEKLLTSHHDNNYVGAVKRIAAIRGEFAKLDLATAPGFLINGLKREELLAWNSMNLHEVYFHGLAAPAAPSALLGQALERDFGSHDRWAAEFSAMGKALGGGSGWVILAYSRHDQRLVNTWASDHTQFLVGSAPILALDMYEHAYQMDYGAKAAAYVDAVMKVLSWGHASETFRKASAV
jgi:Fe-Mn family superoxide dismutase